MSIRNYGLVQDADELRTLIDKLIAADGVIALDIETGYDGPDREKGAVHPETAKVVGVSFTNSTDWARYVPLAHDDAENMDPRVAAPIFWDLVSTGRTIAHNFVFELRHLAKFFRRYLADDPVRAAAVRESGGYFPIFSDTLVESYLVAEHERFGLKVLTKSLFGHTQTELHELFPDLQVNKRKFLRFNVLPLDPKVVEYACEDSVWCLAIHQRYYRRVRDRGLYKVEKAIVSDVQPGMEDEGVCYDWALMRRKADELRIFRDKYNAEVMSELSALAGHAIAINLASAAQVGQVLFDKLGYRTNVYTEKTRDLPPEQRKMSTGKIALERLAQQHPVVEHIRQWKKITRLLGTYLDKYENLYNYADDGRTHPNHLSCAVVTGRFAVADPPYQQSPKKYHWDLAQAKAAHAAGEEPPPGTCFIFNFRDSIVAPPDHYILGFDLSQAELRAIAGEAQEHALLEAFANGEDVHRVTASLMLGVSLAEVTEEQRSIGKMLNFALLYGMSVKGLADRLGLIVEEAQSLMDKYFAGLPAIAAYMEKQIRHGREHRYVLSRFGRILPIWEYDSDNPKIRSKGDRACVNYPIQGCLPSDTNVLTRGGWTPIGEFTDGDEVWTGAEWAPAVRVYRGEAPRVRLHLSDGRTFDCDDRHKLLVKAEPWPEWKPVMEAKGLPLCQDRNLEWGSPDDSSVEDWYWVGRFVGDGALFRNNQQYVVWNMSFDGVKEAHDVQRFKAWLDSKPFKTARSKKGYSYDESVIKGGRGKGVKVQGITPAAVEFWEKHGILVGSKAKDLRVPPQVFQLDRVRREAFCEGYLDADGNSRFDGQETYWSKLTSVSRAGLEDMLRLFQTIGRSGKISNPVVLKGRAKNGSDYVFYDLWLHRKFGELTIEDIEIFDAEPMYTLSVDHPRHSFSSEGLISKNSATGDYMKIAMVRVVAAIKAAGLADKIKLVMNIHDALEFYVHRSVSVEKAIAVMRDAVIFEVDGWPPMQADWHIARRWGSPTEIEVAADGTVTAKGSKVEEVVPAVEIDEDGDEVIILPEVDPEVVREAAQHVVGRTVLLLLHAMPTQDGWQQFVSLARDGLPGTNQIRIITPEGDITLPFTSGLRPDHLAQVARHLGDPELRMEYVVDAVDQLAAGLSL
jgi:DNA polymerase I-like protein with 3'-5' exonuclease and polymerase domains